MPTPAPRTSPPVWCRALIVAERFLIRTFRVAAGLIIGLIALGIVLSAAETLTAPLSSLSFWGLIGNIIAILIGLLIGWIAIGVAIGEKGESRIETAWRRSLQGEDEKIQSERKRLGYED